MTYEKIREEYSLFCTKRILTWFSLFGLYITKVGKGKVCTKISTNKKVDKYAFKKKNEKSIPTSF